MKRYALWLVAAYLLLLAIPLPLFIALSLDKESPSPSPSSTESTAGVTGPGETGAPSNPVEDVTFKLYNIESKRVYEVSARELMLGSTAAEMYPTYHAEALKAQAAAVYSYYTVQSARNRANPDPALEGADFADTIDGYPIYYSDDKLRERWGDNYDTYHAKFSEAVDAVLGKRILHGGEPILAIYHSISAGTTEDASLVWGGSYPYLQPVPSPGDKLNPNYRTEVTFTPEELHEKLASAFDDINLEGDPSGWIDPDVQLSASAMVMEMKIGGKALTGRQLRGALGLRSFCFTAEFKDDLFHFVVLGYGHNVGMSQYGADYLARQGLKWNEILEYYYTDIVIE